MKRRICFLLLVAMVCALFTVTSLAADHDCSTWTTLPTGGALTEGNYVVAADTELTAKLTVAEGVTVTICLNGKKVTAASGYTGNAIESNGTLTICDCGTTERKGYVDATSHLWVEGTAPSGSDEVTLTGGVITGFSEYALYVAKGDTTLESGNIAGNKATKNGGGIYVAAAGKLTMTGGAVVGNYAPYSKPGDTAYGSGGGIYVYRGDLVLSKGESVPYIAYNTAGYHGGGIYVTGASGNVGTITVSDMMVTKNRSGVGAGASAGGIFVNTNCTTDFTGGTITKNTAVKTGTSSTVGRGGGMLCYSALNMKDVTISENESGGQGGGIYCTGGTNAESCTITGNVSAGATGGAYASGTSEFKKCTITNNTAKSTGGGLQGYDTATSKTTLDTCTLTGNKAGTNGGAIYSLANSTVTIKNCTIKDNTAVAGSGAYVFGTLTHDSGTIADDITCGTNGTVKVTGAVTWTGTVTGTITLSDTDAMIIGGNLADGQVTTTVANTAIYYNENADKYSRYYTVLDDAAAKVEANGITMLYKNLTNATNAHYATENVVVMLKDYSSTSTSGYAIEVPGHFRLDMNGFDLIRSKSFCVKVTKDTGVTEIFSSKPGSLLHAGKQAVVTEKGGLYLHDIEIRGDGAQAISFCDVTGKYNAYNKVENCTIVNENWYTFSFNATTSVVDNPDMSKTSMTFVNSTLIAAEAAGDYPLGAQEKAVKGNAIFGGGMKFYSFKNVSNPYMSRVAPTGEKVTKSSAGAVYSVTAAGKTYEKLYLWTTPTHVDTLEELQSATADPLVMNIKLTAAITDNAAVVSVGARTLDLNGKALTVNSLIADSGNVVDNTHKDGKLVVGTTDGKANVTFRSANTQLAVGDANGFWFTESSNATKFEQKDANTATYAFNFYLRNPNAKAYAIEHPETITIGATATKWTGGVGTGDGEEKSLEFDRAGLKEELGMDIVKYLLLNPAHGLRVRLTGIEGFTDVTIRGWVLTNKTDEVFERYTINPAN